MCDLFTIGHSNLDTDTLISMLRKFEISAVADVRSHPYSRFVCQFNQPILKNTLETNGIRYVFLGKELGARPDNPDCYVNGKALYERIAATETFRNGLKRILEGLKKYQIALMCAEKDPLTCHRSVLVCRHLREHDVTINHIHFDGTLESHADLELRMIAKHGFDNFGKSEQQLSIFEQSPSYKQSKEECLKSVYKLQSDDIEYAKVLYAVQSNKISIN